MLRDPRAKHMPYTFATEDKQSLITLPSFRHGLPDKSAGQPICTLCARRVRHRDVSHESSSQGCEKTSDD